MTDRIDDARRTLDEGDLPMALDSLLQAWRATRVPLVADAVEAISAKLTKGEPPIVARTQTAAFQVWMAIAKEESVAKLGLLLPDLFVGPTSRVRSRLATFDLYEADPRLGRALADKMANDWPLLYDKPVGTAIFMLLQKHADRGMVQRLVSANIGGASQYYARWRDRHLGKIEAALAKLPSRPLEERELQTLRAIIADANLAPSKAPTLLATANEVAERLVVADQLLEEGDSRGELVAIQTLKKTRPLTAKERRREAELLHTYARTWLGKLGKMCGPREVTFEDGAIVRVVLSSDTKVREVLDAEEWATVRTISTGWSVSTRALIPLLQRWPNITRVETDLQRAWALAAADPPIESVNALMLSPAVDDATQRLISDLARSTGLPNVVHLGMWWSRLNNPGWIHSSPIISQLVELTWLHCDDVSGAYQLLAAAPSSLTRVNIASDGWELGFPRDETGQFTRLQATFRKPRERGTRETFESMLTTLERLPPFRAIELIEDAPAPSQAHRARFTKLA